MTVQEVAAELGVCPRTVYRRFDRGELPGYRVGTAIRFRRTAIEAFVNGGRQ